MGFPGGGPNNAPPALFGGAIASQNLQTAAGLLAQGIGSVGPWLWGQKARLASWFGVLAGLALIPVYTFCFLLEKQRISSTWTDYLPVTDSRFKQELVFVLSSINNYLIAFFRGQVLVAICDGVLYGIGFLAIGLPYAVLIGAIAIVLTMIPFLGAIVTCCTAVVIAFAQFGDWLHPLLVLGVFASVQTLEGLVISPRIMGGRVGLHPVTIIIAVMVGTTLLGGLLGGILAIPLTAALRVAMFRYIWKKSPAAEAANLSNQA
jgi:predicted PurR-regulated permease PerM